MENETYTDTSRMYKIDLNIKEVDIFYSKNNHSRSFVYQTVYVPLICAFIIGTVLLIAIPKRIKECDEQGRK